MRQNPSTSPSARSPRGLLLLNGALLAVLAAVTFGAIAHAQFRVPGEYTMVGGSIIGWQAGVIYVRDVRNEELVAITYDHNTKKVEGVGYRNLAADMQTVLRRRPGN